VGGRRWGLRQELSLVVIMVVPMAMLSMSVDVGVLVVAQVSVAISTRKHLCSQLSQTIYNLNEVFLGFSDIFLKRNEFSFSSTSTPFSCSARFAIRPGAATACVSH